MILLEAPWQKCVWSIEQIYKRYRSFQLLINASGGIVQCEYVVMWTEIESLVSQCVVSLGLYQCLNSRTPYTDSPPRELIRTHPLTNCENQWRYWSMLIMLPKLILLCGRFSAAVPYSHALYLILSTLDFCWNCYITARMEQVCVSDMYMTHHFPSLFSNCCTV